MAATELLEYNFIQCKICTNCPPAVNYSESCSSRAPINVMADLFRRILEMKQVESINYDNIAALKEEVQALKGALIDKDKQGFFGTTSVKLSYVKVKPIVLVYLYLNGGCIPPDGVFSDDIIIEAQNRPELLEAFEKAEYYPNGVIIAGDYVLVIKKSVDNI